MADAEPLLAAEGSTSRPPQCSEPPESQSRALASAIATLTLGILGR